MKKKRNIGTERMKKERQGAEGQRHKEKGGQSDRRIERKRDRETERQDTRTPHRATATAPWRDPRPTYSLKTNTIINLFNILHVGFKHVFHTEFSRTCVHPATAGRRLNELNSRRILFICF